MHHSLIMIHLIVSKTVKKALHSLQLEIMEKYGVSI